MESQSTTSTTQQIAQCDSEPIEPRIGCVAAAMEIIGAKWTSLLVKELASGPKRFCEFEEAIPKINPRTLSQRLDDLEAHGIVTKERFNEVPPRIEYKLTAKGQDLIPVLRSMAEWGNKYHDSQKHN
jgi:DNA-binding HxlR family transcriptional regulator